MNELVVIIVKTSYMRCNIKGTCAIFILLQKVLFQRA